VHRAPLTCRPALPQGILDTTSARFSAAHVLWSKTTERASTNAEDHSHMRISSTVSAQLSKTRPGLLRRLEAKYEAAQIAVDSAAPTPETFDQGLTRAMKTAETASQSEVEALLSSFLELGLATSSLRRLLRAIGFLLRVQGRPPLAIVPTVSHVATHILSLMMRVVSGHPSPALIAWASAVAPPTPPPVSQKTIDATEAAWLLLSLLGCYAEAIMISGAVAPSIYIPFVCETGGDTHFLLSYLLRHFAVVPPAPAAGSPQQAVFQACRDIFLQGVMPKFVRPQSVRVLVQTLTDVLNNAGEVLVSLGADSGAVGIPDRGDIAPLLLMLGFAAPAGVDPATASTLAASSDDLRPEQRSLIAFALATVQQWAVFSHSPAALTPPGTELPLASKAARGVLSLLQLDARGRRADGLSYDHELELPDSADPSYEFSTPAFGVLREMGIAPLLAMITGLAGGTRGPAIAKCAADTLGECLVFLLPERAQRLFFSSLALGEPTTPPAIRQGVLAAVEVSLDTSGSPGTGTDPHEIARDAGQWVHVFRLRRAIQGAQPVEARLCSLRQARRGAEAGARRRRGRAAFARGPQAAHQRAARPSVRRAAGGGGH
jgi:hypothetical protein